MDLDALQRNFHKLEREFSDFRRRCTPMLEKFEAYEKLRAEHAAFDKLQAQAHEHMGAVSDGSTKAPAAEAPAPAAAAPAPAPEAPAAPADPQGGGAA